MKEFTDAILMEANSYGGEWRNEFSSLYFGGGTPSLLPEKFLDSIFEGIHKHFNISTNAEVTFEANPDDLSKETLNVLKNLGVNRLSIGTQSFREEDLKLMNRAHDSQQAIESLKLAQDLGFENLNIDLIYGIPGLSLKDWEGQLISFLDLNIPHLSAYALTVEPNTILQHQIRKGIVANVTEEEAADHFLLLSQMLRSNGFEHYEVSNLSKPNWRSKHNSSYWTGKPYLGLGPSAHSFNGNQRFWNIPNLKKYIESSLERQTLREIEDLNPDQAFNEAVMTGFRTIEGLNKDSVRTRFGDRIYSELVADIENLRNPRIKEDDQRFYLEPNDYLYADRIASDLMRVD